MYVSHLVDQIYVWMLEAKFVPECFCTWKSWIGVWKFCRILAMFKDIVPGTCTDKSLILLCSSPLVLFRNDCGRVGGTRSAITSQCHKIRRATGGKQSVTPTVAFIQVRCPSSAAKKFAFVFENVRSCS